MTALTGGIRTRSINESIYRMVKDGLTDLGWFNPAREHAPIHFITEPMDRDEAIPLNTLNISPEDTDDFETGLGESSVEERATYYIDFYGENNALAIEMIHDVRDIIGGRLPAIGRTHPICQVYDYRETPPANVGYVSFEDIVVDRSRSFPKPWLKHWFMVRFDVIDTYGGPDA